MTSKVILKRNHIFKYSLFIFHNPEDKPLYSLLVCRGEQGSGAEKERMGGINLIFVGAEVTLSEYSIDKT